MIAEVAIHQSDMCWDNSTYYVVRKTKLLPLYGILPEATAASEDPWCLVLGLTRLQKHSLPKNPS